MLGKMQDWPLLISKILEHGETNHPAQEVISMLPEGGQVRTDFQTSALRARKCAEMLTKLGVKMGDRVATLAWNTHRHMEVWFAVSGMGAVIHTVNPRLFADQLVYIMNHAEDQVLLFDVTFRPLVEALAPQLKTIKHFIQLTDSSHVGEGALEILAYEDLIAGEHGTYQWPSFDENTPCGLCYTSGTTGNPKGVMYSHRSNFLHTLIAMSGDTLAISSLTVIMPIVPMFHANAWGVPYAAVASGAKMVFIGHHHDPETLQKLIKDEQVTATAAVPTIWMAMLKYLKETGKDLKPLSIVTIGGAACPRSMIETFQNDYGVRVNHAWGMTEMSPLGTVGSENAAVSKLGDDEKMDYQIKQGRPVLGVEMCIKDDDGNTLPRDGESAGRVMVRGPWIIGEYFGGAGGTILDDDGWFDTGDVAKIDTKGFMQITDRSKDVIKSGGEWISSIDLENEALSYQGVTEAAVIGVPHPKWSERPLMVVTVDDGTSLTVTDMQKHLDGRIAKWWMPDDLVIVDEIPHTATGKISKKDLRIQFADYKLPSA